MQNDANLSKPLNAIFAIPGDIDTPTGGYAYARALLAAAPGAGLALRVMTLPGDFPDPAPGSVELAARALAAIRPDVPVLVDGLAFGAMPPAALDAVRAPMAVLLHHPLGLESGLAPERATALLASERAAVARARAVIVPSETTRADVVATLGKDQDAITVAVPGLVKPPAMQQSRETPPLILSVGSLTPRKGHDVLLEALGRLGTRRFEAVIAGAADRDAEWAAQIRAQAEPMASVRLLGAVGRSELDALYARATLFCLPSRHEGYGMVFAEAMAHGLPIVAADIAAAREVITPDAGLLVPCDDPAAVAEALAALLDDLGRAAKMGAAGAAHAATLPDWSQTAQRVAGVLRKLVA
jgi:glycosyltransferase involved in cell wall biosynthesis